MLTAAALGAGPSANSAGATTPSSLCSTPINLLQQNALLSYSPAATSFAQPIFQQQFQSLAANNTLPGSNYEGIPIFIVPTQTGAPGNVSLAALQRAAEIKATLLANPLQEPKVDTSKHHHVFVGDLATDVSNTMLKDAFAPFGEVSEAKVIRDSQTQKSKGYGFVSFPQREHAEKAIEAMNGQWIGKRAVRTNWASRKPQDENRNTLTFEQVFNSTKPDNTSVYVGNISQNTTDDHLREPFSPFGEINEIRMFKAQGYAFVRFERKEDATKAIMEMNGKDIAGNTVRCSWGRTQQSQAAQAAPLLTDLATQLLTTNSLVSQPFGLPGANPNPYTLPYIPQIYASPLLPQWPQV